MPHADVQPQRVVHQLQKPQDVVEVVQRFPDAHEDDVGDWHAPVRLGEDHLLQHFSRRQVPDLAPQGGGAEGAPHAASHLAGNADGVAVAVAHEHRLNAVAVVELPQVLDGAVRPGHLFPGRSQTAHPVRPRQLLPEGLRYVAHFIKGADAPVKPGKHLFPPEGWLPHVPQGRRQLLQGHGPYVYSHDFLILQM